jgi:ribosome-associated protein
MTIEKLKEPYLYLDDALEDAKAQDVCWIDISKKSSLGDFFIIATASSNRHAYAVAEKVKEEAKKNNAQILGMSDGGGDNSWVVIDLADVIVHIFLEETRQHYDLESLWNKIQK